MKTPQIVRHGELLLKPTTLPEGAVLQQATKKFIAAHSETGHHHVLEATQDLTKMERSIHKSLQIIQELYKSFQEILRQYTVS